MINPKNHGTQGNGSIRKGSDGRWEGRYTVGINKQTGKQIQKTVYGKTKAETRKQVTSIMAEIDAGTYIEPTKTTLVIWLDIWIRDYTSDKKYSTLKG